MALYTGKLDLADGVTDSLDFEKCPHMPTIVQDEAGQVLMLAYSTPESLRAALREGRGIYYSRSRNALWRKGETSGHTQTLLRCRTDCDRDTLLFTVRQADAACHTGAYSCFEGGMPERRASLPALMDILKQRKAAPPGGSYSAKLFANRELLLRKLMEEAFEVTRAPDRQNLVWEIADALYFLSVLAVDEGVEWNDIEAELGGRRR
jgi:phosphoribosyl-ATP pyrophosphohydrolase